MPQPKATLPNLSDHFHADVAGAAHADGLSSAAAQIDRAAHHKWSTVVDANDD